MYVCGLLSLDFTYFVLNCLNLPPYLSRCYTPLKIGSESYYPSRYDLSLFFYLVNLLWYLVTLDCLYTSCGRVIVD